jgi:hypothetical protein
MQILGKRTRHERKIAQRAKWDAERANRERFEREHPVLSGAVKVVDYVPPRGSYTPMHNAPAQRPPAKDL